MHGDPPVRRFEPDAGFTLVELLVVVCVIAILIAIAVPRYLGYQQTSHDKAAESDLRATVTELNLCFADNDNHYPASITFAAGVGTPSAPSCAKREIVLSGGTVLGYTPLPAGCTDDSCTSFVMTATNTGGTGRFYRYDSSAGGTIQ